MTNQQGAPEALRTIQRYKIGYHTDEWGARSSTPGGISDPSGQWVLYKDHVAALVEAQQPAKAESLRQILTDPENQPNQFGVQFLMHGAKMAFRIGNRQFCLDYEPDEPGEFEFMRDALISAFSIFTPDVKLAQQPAPSAAVVGDNRVPEAWTNLLAYVLQDDLHNRLTPRIIDIAYTAFMQAKRPNDEDGGASDWFNDTRPMVRELIAKLRKDLIEELAGAPQPSHTPQADPLQPVVSLQEQAGMYADDFAPKADSQPACVTVDDAIRIAKSIGVREYGPNTRNWSFEYSQLAQFVALLTAAAYVDADRAARATADSVLEDAARLTTEQEHAIRQGHEIAASDSYFEARPQIDSNDRRKVFLAGFERGWDAARKQGANHD